MAGTHGPGQASQQWHGPQQPWYGGQQPPGPQPQHAHRKSRLRDKSLLLPVGIVVIGLVVAVAVIIGQTVLHHSGGPGCWSRSQDSSVITESQVDRHCIYEGRLVLGPELGGTYTNLTAPVSQPGTLICTATPPPGNPNSWKVWAAPGADPAEAVALCRFFKRDGAGTVRMTHASAGGNSQAPTQESVAFNQGVEAAISASYEAVHSAGGESAYCLADDKYASTSNAGTQWYDGCMAELKSSPPSPPPVPTYLDGYNAGSRVSASQIYKLNPNGDIAGAADNWCGYNDPTPNPPPDEGYVDMNGNPYPSSRWYDGCMAEMKARGIP